ncbi:glycoside hydrolase [Xylariaceae sp. FL1019]|nr:glycoside hydrolase [Xylariaceae sp. FL1019]
MKNVFARAFLVLLPILSFAMVNADQQPCTKRVVQYYGIQVNDQGTKFHISQLVNNTDNKTYATNVLMGAFGLLKNKTIGLNGENPAREANDWFWDEIKMVQDNGVKVSLWMRQGYQYLKKNNPTFEAYYAALNDTLIKYDFDGIDLDIEDAGSANAMTLEDTIHLIKRLRSDFGSDFIITLAPVSNALLSQSENVSKFSYQALEKQAGAEIDWYNAQFYGGSWKGLKTPAFYKRCIKEGGWKPDRIVTTITTSSDFTYPLPRSSWVGLNETGPTIEKLVDQYADFGGVGGFDFYDAEPGGYAAPWEWSRWAARRMGA